MLLSTNNDIGQCYISTSQLDGERNLKPKLAPPETQDKLQNLSAGLTVDAEAPIKDIYRFDGTVNGKFKADLKQFLPRGSYIKNSNDVYAIVVYTGVETKLVMNQGKYNFKVATLTNQFNMWLLFHVLLFVLLIIFSSQLGNRFGN